MVTGFQRQHRKNHNYIPTEGADSHTTDQYTRLIKHVCHANGIYEAYSKSCELAAVAGLNLMQPYLDYTGEDPAQGELKVKVWEYNSFLIDPFARQPDLSDAQFIWCQEYISKKTAEERFPDKIENIAPMAGTPQRYGSFYFLPENYNMARNDLMVLSYVWYRWKRKKKRLYSRSRNQFFDFSEKNANLEQILYAIPDLEIVEVSVPTWKLAVVLNDQLMFQGDNPLGFDSCPFIANFWYYDPHLNYYDLRDRSLVRAMRSPQFLMNRQIILSHDQKETTINSGWIRKVNAVANEDNLRKGNNGWDIIINEGSEIGKDIAKIEPNYVPESDFALANRMYEMIYGVSGVNMESWTADDQKQISALTMSMKQAANLLVLQKFYDQWDYSFKLLGDRLLQIALNNWNEAKIGLLLGEEPSPYFYSHIFAKYQVLVEEGLNTPTQRNQQAQQLLEINQIYGREVFPPSMVIKDMNISGKAEALEFLKQQEQVAAAQAEHAQNVASVIEEAKLKELYSKAAANIATARERHGRAEADIGLFEERLSEISQNRSVATKNKVEALAKLVEVIEKYGQIEAHLAGAGIESISAGEESKENAEKADAKRTAMANDFVAQMLASMGGQAQGQ